MLVFNLNIYTQYYANNVTLINAWTIDSSIHWVMVSKSTHNYLLQIGLKKLMQLTSHNLALTALFVRASRDLYKAATLLQYSSQTVEVSAQTSKTVPLRSSYTILSTWRSDAGQILVTTGSNSSHLIRAAQATCYHLEDSKQRGSWRNEH